MSENRPTVFNATSVVSFFQPPVFAIKNGQKGMLGVVFLFLVRFLPFLRHFKAKVKTNSEVFEFLKYLWKSPTNSYSLIYCFISYFIYYDCLVHRACCTSLRCAQKS